MRREIRLKPRQNVLFIVAANFSSVSHCLLDASKANAAKNYVEIKFQPTMGLQLSNCVSELVAVFETTCNALQLIGKWEVMIPG